MITIRPGSHVNTLLTVISFTGEYPVTALGLLGSERSYKDLVYKLSMPQEFRFPDKEERFSCRLLTVSGKGKRKTIRLHKSALPLLKYWDEDAYETYMAEYDDHTFSGNARHVERNHLVAESAVICMKAGIEANPLDTPDVMEDDVRSLQIDEPYFYFSRELKRVNDYEMNKIRFTRLAGAIVYPGGAYAVYNHREGMQRWMGEGELKIKLHLQEIFFPMKGFEFPLREAAIMFGANYEVALDMLREMKETMKMDKGLFNIYKNIFFVPQNEFGVKLLRVLTTPDWKEKILDWAFDDEDRSYDRGIFTFDAYADGVFEFSFLDGDLGRLFRFREAILDREGEYRIICYPEQLVFLEEYFGDMVEMETVKMNNLQDVLEIKESSLL